MSNFFARVGKIVHKPWCKSGDKAVDTHPQFVRRLTKNLLFLRFLPKNHVFPPTWTLYLGHSIHIKKRRSAQG